MEVKQVSTSVISQVVKERVERDKYYEIMPHIGDINEPTVINKWTFVPLELEEDPLPDWVQADLDDLMARYPIRRVFVGHEPEPEEKREKPKMPEIQFPKLPAVDFGSLAKFALGFLGVCWLLSKGILLFIITSVLLFAAVVDPIVVVTFEDEEDWMLCIATWVKQPEN